jgi:hypothetical protein
MLLRLVSDKVTPLVETTRRPLMLAMAVLSTFSEALALYERATRVAFEHKPRVVNHDDEDFWAMVRLDQDGYAVHINAGAAENIRKLWSSAWSHPVLVGNGGLRLPEIKGENGLQRLCELSLTWLLLHELVHIRLGHLPYLGEAEIVRRSSTQSVARLAEPALQVDGIDRDEMRHCFEMQSDEDATGILLSYVGPADYSGLRIRLASIVAVLALIERSDSQSSLPDTDHPGGATRFMALLFWLLQMHLYPDATVEPDGATSRVKPKTPPTKEQMLLHFEKLVAPVVGDAMMIARSAGVQRFVTDLGNLGDIIRDFFTAQNDDEISPGRFRTRAGQDWARLLPVNENIMRVTGLRS